MLRVVTTKSLISAYRGRFFSNCCSLNKHKSTNAPIKIILKDGEVVTLPPHLDGNQKRITDARVRSGSKIQGRIKPKELRLRKRNRTSLDYNSDRMNKEAYKAIITDSISKNSFNVLFDTYGIKQETVILNDIIKKSDMEGLHPPQLTGDLHRVLYQPMTLHQLKDPRSNVYLFDPKLEKITPEFLEKKIYTTGNQKDPTNNKENAPLFITPHRDKSLMAVAKKLRKRYISSSSSMTAILSHFHFLLSNFRGLNIEDTPISDRFDHRRCNFSRGAKFPATVILRKMNNKIRSIDSDKTFDKEMVLSLLGHSLENFLTVDSKSPKLQDDFYHYSKINDFIVRSQLDAYDPSLPGTGVFDLKTRAVSAIRHDLPYVEKNNNVTGYRLDRIHGQYESFEREFYELIRSTLLKYSLQSRIGKMDGIFVAYHNISKLFGFQYLPQEELDYIIHSKYSHKFLNLLNQRNDDIINDVGQRDYIVNHLYQGREIANSIAESEFGTSFVMLKNALKYLEGELDKKLGPTNWEKCKIMMQTESKKVRLSNNEIINYPVLNIIAIPLPSDYHDESVINPKSSQDDIQRVMAEYSSRLEKEVHNPKFVENMVGIQLRVFHKQTNSEISKSGNIPNGKKLILEDNKRQNSYYSKTHTFQTPNFMNSEDVENWKVNSWWTPIKDSRTICRLYLEYCNIKLEALKHQSEVISDNQSVLKDQKKRIKFSKSGNEANERNNQFKKVLRAYGEKGALAEESINEDAIKTMWNS
ncbi:similar to Saccharomyces cerevisiae YOR017W PET127 Protein with a role in 5'-end processing of mitochondrial RNAs, located in the mitochondrial membrane [Maudiozyma saulgeensis]|uniref:Similar to Saccharomyces cerevisiae YOR017W PET127 Protein with a role in 5'-end processing of mitochondrial RNAs, located in the mitochondrial membrane n=1 Tax=Maudiozyma saulgeensis TaxID=1789683 RepID=A0A1X7R308_9SACH|nr:similar to Saccharomyces cerevisiae YOR017W PET127 Protein with a role in 5'-end processing of mitochondrial RNAs, located in the mitochondrial membrane [Kazachstania saulgeensis]